MDFLMETGLISDTARLKLAAMVTAKSNVKLPENPITLSVQQIDELNRSLSRVRHDIANHLTIVITAAELASQSPEKSKEHLSLLLGQPPRITDAVKNFTAVFEQALGITRF